MSRKPFRNCSQDRISRRRRTLLGMIGGAGIALESLNSGKWSKPVVRSIVLPAHAQTSADQTGASPVVCPGAVLTIPGAAATCENPAFAANNTFHVDDTGDCPPELVAGPSTAQVTVGNVSVTILEGLMFGDPLNTFTVVVGNETRESTLDCDQLIVSGTGDFNLPFVADSGAPWTASFSITAGQFSDSVTLSAITLSPM